MLKNKSLKHDTKKEKWVPSEKLYEKRLLTDSQYLAASKALNKDNASHVSRKQIYAWKNYRFINKIHSESPTKVDSIRTTGR